MTNALHRVLLIGCCVLAVVAAGSFFPAAGYAGYPDAPAVDEGHYVDDGTGPGDGSTTAGEDGADSDVNGTESDANGDEQPSETDTESEDDSEETDTETETDDGTETDNETGTETESDGGSESSASGTFATVLWIATVGGLGIVFWRATSPARARRRGWYAGDLPSGTLPRLRFRLALIPQATMAGTIAVSRRLPSLFDAASRTGRAAGAGIGAVVADLGRGFATATVALGAGLGGAIRGLGGLLALSSGFGTLLSDLNRPSLPRRSRRSRVPTRSSTADDSAAPEPETPPETIQEAWTEMVEAVDARRRRHRTPGEYARIAIGRGLPAKPVGTLTSLFRDVRYGGASPSADRRRRALEAYERIERSADGGSDGDVDDGDADAAGGADGRGADGRASASDGDRR